MKLYLLTILLLFYTGCSKRYEVEMSKGIHYGKNIYSEIERVYQVPWKVGLKREVEISQGARFFVTVPLFSEDAKELLMNKYGVDSWVFRFKRIRRGKATVLGHFYLKFVNMTRNTKNISVSLFYQAAAVSKKFRFFHCPAFEHRYKVTEYQLNKRSKAKANNLFIRSVERLKAKVTRFKFSPMILPAGRSLLGNYIVDMAFYSSGPKQRFSDWHPVNGIINIQQERSKIITSCAGIKEEIEALPQSRVPDIRDFEIK